jgi:hypothetical protein
MPSGYFGWAQEILFNRVFFGGRIFTNLNEDAAGPLTVTQPAGVIVVPMHAGNGVVWAPYRGADKPLAAEARTFSLAILADEEQDFYWFMALRAQGAAVYYCPGLPAVDSFQAISGQVYQLTRPQAIGIVPAVTTGTHPPRFVLDGVDAPGAATVAGRSVTAAASGLLSVWYMPVYSVAFIGDVAHTIAEGGRYNITAELGEVAA